MRAPPCCSSLPSVIALAISAACASSPGAAPDSTHDAAGTSSVDDAAASAELPGAELPVATDTPAVCAAVAPALTTMSLTVDGGRIRDALGREVWLRGVNAGGRSKFPPFVPFAFDGSGVPAHAGRPAFDAALARYADRAVDWGLDVVRLPVTWEALEPVRGVYDDAFLERYAAIAAAFGERGIRVIVDVHQDVFARAYCGDGFPEWALPEPKPLPTGSCAQWFNGYNTSPEVAAAFDRFWQNEDALQTAFEALWRRLAARMVTVPGVVAFEILNEPGWGSMKSSEFLPTVLTPFYTRLVKVIREVAPGVPVLFDATGVDAVVAATALERPEGEGLIFAPHYYDPTVIISGQWTTRDADYADLIGGWRTQVDEWGMPGLIGEFGIRATAEGGAEYLRRNFDALDALALHGTAWEYSDAPEDWNDEGMSVVDETGAETSLAASLVRVYPLAVSGTIRAFSYDADAREAVLEVDAVPGVTELSAPARLYATPPRVALSGAGCVAWAEGRVVVAHEATERVTITVGP